MDRFIAKNLRPHTRAHTHTQEEKKILCYWGSTRNTNHTRQGATQIPNMAEHKRENQLMFGHGARAAAEREKNGVIGANYNHGGEELRKHRVLSAPPPPFIYPKRKKNGDTLNPLMTKVLKG